MKKLLLALLLFIPITASATTAVPWQQTNLTDGFIFPALVNSVKQGIIVSASSTIFNLSSNTSTSTNATSTNLYISGNASTTNLFTNTFFAGGLVTCNTGGSSALIWSGGTFGCNTISGGSGSPYPFPLTGNATSTKTQFNGGLTSFASSTIGNATTGGGLTISGGATTTGRAYFASNVGIGTTTPLAKLSVSSFNGGAQPQFIVASSTGSGATTTAFIIDQYGNVGVGTTPPSPATTLYVQNSDNGANAAQLTLVGGAGLGNAFAGLRFAFQTFDTPGVGWGADIQAVDQAPYKPDLIFRTRSSPNDNSAGTPTEKMRITSDGKVGIDTPTPQNQLDVNGSAAVGSYAGTKAAPSNGLIVSGNVGIGPNLQTGVTDLYVGDSTQSGDNAAQLTLQGGNATGDPVAGVNFAGAGDGTIASIQGIDYEDTDGGGGLSFKTSPGNPTLIQAMKINDSGQVFITADAGPTSDTPALDVNLGTSGTIQTWENSNGSCSLDESGLSCSSDATLKTNIAPLLVTSSLDEINSLTPVSFNWKGQPTTNSQVGLVAQDVQKVFPQIVSTSTKGTLLLNYTKLIPYLIDAIQSLTARVTALESSPSAATATVGSVSPVSPAGTTYYDAGLKKFVCWKSNYGHLIMLTGQCN